MSFLNFSQKKNVSFPKCGKSSFQQKKSKLPSNWMECSTINGEIFPKSKTSLKLDGIQVVSCAARPLTLRVASGYRGGVFRTARLTARTARLTARTAEPATVGSGRVN